MAALTTVEAAVWAETFWEEAPVTYPTSLLPLSIGATYSVDELKRNSWTFWFNQSAHPVRDGVPLFINSYNPLDYALALMRIDDCSVRNTPYSHFDRPNMPGLREPYKDWIASRNLAHTLPAMLKKSRRPPYVTPADLEPPLGAQSIGCADENIPADAFGWPSTAHSGGVYGKDIVTKTPLYNVWRWYQRLITDGSYPIGKE